MNRAYRSTILAALMIAALAFAVCAQDYKPQLDKGIALHEAKDYAGAIEAYSQAIKLKPDHFLIYYNRGGAYEAMKKYDLAIADFTKAIELQPKLGYVYAMRAKVYTMLSQDDKAVADYSSAISLESVGEYYIGRSEALGRLKKYDLALADSAKLVESFPDAANVFYLHGKNQIGKQNFELAIAAFTRAIVLRPDYRNAYEERGWAYMGLKNYTAALADANKSIELNPKRSYSYYLRALIYGYLQNTEKQIADYTTAIALDPEYSPSYLNRAHSYSLLGKHDLALADYTRYIQLNPKFTGAYYSRGLAYLRIGDLDRAFADASRSIELDPTAAFSYAIRGKVYLAQAKPELALADFNKGIDLAPRHSDTWFYTLRGYYRLANRQPAEAYKDAAAAMSILPPASKQLMSFQAICYFALRKQKKDAEAKELIESWLAVTKTSDWPRPVIEYLSGRITADKLLAEAKTPEQQTVAHTYIGEMLYVSGKTAEANERFRWVFKNGKKFMDEYDLARIEMVNTSIDP